MGAARFVDGWIKPIRSFKIYWAIFSFSAILVAAGRVRGDFSQLRGWWEARHGSHKSFELSCLSHHLCGKFLSILSSAVFVQSSQPSRLSSPGLNGSVWAGRQFHPEHKSLSLIQSTVPYLTKIPSSVLGTAGDSFCNSSFVWNPGLRSCLLGSAGSLPSFTPRIASPQGRSLVLLLC